MFGLAAEMTRGFGLDSLAIIGMTECPPNLDPGRLQILETTAEHLGPARIERQGIRDEIPLPGPDLCPVDDVGETATLLRQRQLGALTLGDISADSDDRLDSAFPVDKSAIEPLQPPPSLDRFGALIDQAGVRRVAECIHRGSRCITIIRMDTRHKVTPDQPGLVATEESAVGWTDVLEPAHGIRADDQILDVLHD